MSKSVVRSVKNVTKGYSSVQVKVRNATSNDAWGPTGADMADIAQMTYNSSSEFYEVMDMLDKRLNDKGKNWRHVLKSLKVLDYCLHEGSELVVTWARKNIFVVKTLREFQYLDEDSRDVGQNVRTSAKELTSLILDEERLRTERKDRKQWKSRVTGLEDYNPPSTYGMGSDPSNERRQRRRMKNSSGNEEDDLEYKLAVEASKNEAEEQRRRRAKAEGKSEDDPDLDRAIKLSQEEEELRRRQLEQSNAVSLFDDTPVQEPQPTGYNQGYQQQGAVDFFGNPIDQQQQQQLPQTTGYLNNMYSQQTGMLYQQTGFQNGYSNNPYQQQQPTGFDQSPYGQQAQYMQPQQTSFNANSNPYGFDQSQQFQQSQPEQLPMQTGSNNPWASSNQTPDSVAAQPTGSNNPFASSSFARPQTAAARPPTLNTLQEQKTATQFNSFSPPQTQSAFSQYAQNAQAQPTPQIPLQTAQSPKEMDPHAARLNALLSSGEGQDTFGNVGNMRIPAQHTAPGTFVNSAGSSLGRLQPVATGTNPFMQSQSTGFQQAQPQVPAQTGPGGFGGGGYGSNASNPFGAQSTQRQQGQGASLIDI